MKIKKILAVALATIIAMTTLVLPATASAVQSALIDTTKTGTLNVFKYEMDDTAKATFSGTGEKTDEAQLPDGVSPLEGVTFKATRVVDLMDSDSNLNTTYYTTAGVSLPTVTEAKAMTALATYTKTTDSDGYAAFTNLPLGIYLVQETSSPNQVTGKVDDFLVSIPMTKSSGDAWNYNVYVYPKNETKYSDITIKKVDATTKATLEGAVFTLEKSSDNKTWKTVETGLTTDENGTVSPTDSLGYNTYFRLTETKAPTSYILDDYKTTFYINSDGYTCDAKTQTVIDSSNPYLITVTNSKPTVEKSINTKDDNGNGVYVTSATKKISNTVQYKITIKTPALTGVSNLSTLKTLKVTDTLPDGLLFKDGTAPTFGSVTCTYKISEDMKTLTVNYDTSTLKPNTTYAIYCYTVFDKDTINNTTDKSKYYGTALNNTCDLTYSTATNTNDDNDTTNTITSNDTDLHMSGFQFKKVAEDGVTPLTGVKFRLYTSLDDAKNGVSSTDYVSDENGIVSIYGLSYGGYNDKADTTNTTTYYLVETATLSGYNLISEPIEIEVGKDSWNYENTQFKVVNSKKTILPLTGGFGTAIFVTFGVALVSFGSVLFVFARKKRKTSK